MKLSEVVFDFNETFGELMLIGEPKEVYVYAMENVQMNWKLSATRLFLQGSGKSSWLK